jgi:hypothetical protein
MWAFSGEVSRIVLQTNYILVAIFVDALSRIDQCFIAESLRHHSQSHASRLPGTGHCCLNIDNQFFKPRL